MSHASYISELFDPNEFTKSVDLTVKIVNERFKDVHYIACMGVSGISLASVVAYLTKKRLFIVRKDNDDSHSFNAANSANRDPDEVDNYSKFCEFDEIEAFDKTAIIIDDLISSGNTIRRIINKLVLNDILPTGIILYHETGQEFKFHDAILNIDIPTISTETYMD